MTGWKTKAGGIGFILTGLGMVIDAVSGDDFDAKKIMAGVALISAGFTAMGIGHKIEKAAEKTANNKK